MLEPELDIWAEKNGFRSAGQADFRKGFTSLDHILTLKDLAEAVKKGFIAALCTSKKPFNTIPQPQLVQRLEAHGVPVDMQ